MKYQLLILGKDAKDLFGRFLQERLYADIEKLGLNIGRNFEVLFQKDANKLDKKGFPAVIWFVADHPATNNDPASLYSEEDLSFLRDRGSRNIPILPLVDTDA